VSSGLTAMHSGGGMHDWQTFSFALIVTGSDGCGLLCLVVDGEFARLHSDTCLSDSNDDMIAEQMPRLRCDFASLLEIAESIT